MKKPNLIVRIIGKLFLAVFLFIAGTFTVYFFNLDMKLTAMLEPILLKHYDKIKRDTRL